MIDPSQRQVHMDCHLRLNAEFWAALQWWATFLDTWNGVSIMSALCRLFVDVLLMPGVSPTPLAPGDAEPILAASG